MIAQLLLNVGTSIAGGLVGYMESKSSNMLELEKIKAEVQRDQMLGQQNQLKDFYETLDRADDPKKFATKGFYFFGFGKAYEKITYKYVPIPARVHRYRIMLILAAAYAFAVCASILLADIPIQSFPSAPESYKWLNLLGFSLVEGTKNSVYQLTLGGIILPLLSPVSFAITKWLTGSDIRK